MFARCISSRRVGGKEREPKKDRERERERNRARGRERERGEGREGEREGVFHLSLSSRTTLKLENKYA